MVKKLIWPVIIILSAVSTSILVWSDAGTSLRSILSFWFIFICPGMSVIHFFNMKDFLSEIVLAVALSLALSTFLANLMLVAHLWSPSGELAVLIIISLIGANLQIKKVLNNIPVRYVE